MIPGPVDLPSTFPANRYQNSVRLLILRLEKDKKLSKFSAAITKLLQEDIRPEHEFAVGVIAAAGHDSEVAETVAPAVRGEWWNIDHVRDLRDASEVITRCEHCLLYTSPSPRDKRQSRMPSSA